MTSSADNDAALFAELQAAVCTPTPDAAVPLAVDLAPDAIPGYHLLEVVHRRGARAVYRARDVDSGAMVAIKILLGEPWSSARERERFVREAELTHALAHPDIVPVLDSGAERGHRYHVRPWIAGEPLDAYAARTRADRGARVRLLVRICRAVDHAHRRAVLHRDLKPSNILVDAEGAPHLVDFGVGKLLGPQTAGAASGVRVTGSTATHEFLGTAAYASPEQLCGEPLTTASDVYALGVIACELLTDALPHDASGSFAQVSARICRDEPRVAAADGLLRAILLRALEKDASRRYATAGALADDLEAYAAGRPLALPGLPRLYLWRRALRRHQRAISLAALAAVATLTGGGFALRLYLRERTQRATATEVQELLSEMIAAAQPDRMGGGVPLVDVLDQVAVRLGSTLRQAPDVQAEVQLTLGDTYRRLHLLDRAQTHLGAALARWREVNAPAATLARTLLLLGSVQAGRGHPDAVPTLRQAFSTAAARFGRDSVEAAQARSALGDALASAPIGSDLREAREHLDAAHAVLVRALGADHHEVAASLHRLGCWHWHRGDGTEAARGLRAAATMFTAHEARDDGSAVACYNSLAAVLQGLGELDEAERWLEHSAQLTSRLFGEQRTSDMLRRFARLHFDRGDYALSETFALRSVAHAVRGVGPSHGGSDSLRSVAGDLAHGLADPRGRAALVAAFQALRAHHGPGEYELATWLHGLAALAAARGQPELRADLLREALAFRCRLFALECPVRADCLIELADCLEEKGGSAEATGLREEAARIRAAHAGARREARR